MIKAPHLTARRRRAEQPDPPDETHPVGPTFKATSVDGNSEFVRSWDDWFRPANLVSASDGTLYALDTSREVIEAIHIPLDVVMHLDLRRGRDQGRIYRIAPTGFAPKSRPA